MSSLGDYAATPSPTRSRPQGELALATMLRIGAGGSSAPAREQSRRVAVLAGCALGLVVVLLAVLVG